MQPITAVLFDLDDTLLNWANTSESFGVVHTAHAHKLYAYLAVAGHNLPTTELFLQTYRQTLFNSWQAAKETWAGISFAEVMRQTLTAVGLDLGTIDLTAVMQAYDWGPVAGVFPFPDAIPVLQQLKSQGYKIGLVTNSMLPMWMRDIELDAYELRHFFDARVTSGDTGYMKPHPAIYWHTLGLLEATPQQTVFVGDRPANDIAGANAVGMFSVLMSPPHLNRPLDGVVPDYTINQLEELLPILALLEQGVSSKQ